LCGLMWTLIYILCVTVLCRWCNCSYISLKKF
jgi:hypothetical protein